MKPGWRNHTPDRERCPERTRSLWGTLCWCVLAAAPWGAWMAWQNDCLGVVYEVNALRSEGERLTELERRLAVEQASAQSLPQVERWAEGSGHLARPEPERVVILPRMTRPPADLLARTEEGARAISTEGMR